MTSLTRSIPRTHADTSLALSLSDGAGALAQSGPITVEYGRTSCLSPLSYECVGADAGVLAAKFCLPPGQQNRYLHWQGE